MSNGIYRPGHNHSSTSAAQEHNAAQLSQNRRLHEMARGNYELSAKSVGRSSIVQSTPEEIMNQDNNVNNGTSNGGSDNRHHQVKVTANVH